MVPRTGHVPPRESCDATITSTPVLDNLPLYHYTIHNERSSCIGLPTMPRIRLGQGWRVLSSVMYSVPIFSHTISASFLSLVRSENQTI